MLKKYLTLVCFLLFSQVAAAVTIHDDNGVASAVEVHHKQGRITYYNAANRLIRINHTRYLLVADPSGFKPRKGQQVHFTVETNNSDKSRRITRIWQADI